MVNLKNILIPTDFSENSIPAYDLAQHMAMHHNAVLHVLHVMHGRKHGDPNDKLSESSFIMSAEEEMRRFLAKIPQENIRIKEVLVPGQPCDEIINYSRKMMIDLIVISSHGWSGLLHLPMGSTTQKVMTSSEIPVICINPKPPVLRKKSAKFRSSWAEYWVG